MDEAFSYARLIADRRRAQYRMELAIVHNPHIEKPQDLWEALTNPPQPIVSLPPEPPPPENDTLDKAAFARLAQVMSSNPRMKVKC